MPDPKQTLAENVKRQLTVRAEMKRIRDELTEKKKLAQQRRAEEYATEQALSK